MKAAREMAIASKKRIRDLSTSTSSGDEDSGSDFGEPKPTTKRQKANTKTSSSNATTATTKPDPFAKIPKVYQSKEGHAYFTQKWYREVFANDDAWTDFVKKIGPKVLNKRLKAEIVVTTGSNSGANESTNAKSRTVAPSKTDGGAGAVKRPRVKARVDPIDVADPEIEEDVGDLETESVIAEAKLTNASRHMSQDGRDGLARSIAAQREIERQIESEQHVVQEDVGVGMSGEIGGDTENKIAVSSVDDASKMLSLPEEARKESVDVAVEGSESVTGNMGGEGGRAIAVE